MSNLKYSIIYAVIRPEISEQLSVGLIIIDGDTMDVRYSKKKLDILKSLYTDKEYKFVSRVVSSLKNNSAVNSIDKIDYISRYSNNLVTFSPLQTIDIASKDWLFSNYVYAGERK